VGDAILACAASLPLGNSNEIRFTLSSREIECYCRRLGTVLVAVLEKHAFSLIQEVEDEAKDTSPRWHP
jgi:hypothetical protein